MQKVAIQGAGFVGSAFALACASIKKNNNLLFDVSIIECANQKNLINKINSGIFPFKTNDKKLPKLLKLHIKKNLNASSNIEIYKSSKIIISCIGFDSGLTQYSFERNKKKYQKSIEEIAKNMLPGTLLIIQSTLPPGFTNSFIKPIIEKEFLKRNISTNKILLSHSFERVMPGKNYYNSIVNNWRVCGSINEKSMNESRLFFSKLVNYKKYPITFFKDPLYSETAKILENTFRAVNIAFIDEWTKYSEIIKVNLFEVIKAIRQRPTHANIMYPGFGVGGYCLTKDPKFAELSSKYIFKNNKLKFPYTSAALAINAKMPLYTFNKIKLYFSNKLKNKKILILGVSYKDGVADTRKSPTELLYLELKKKGAIIDLQDPLVGYWPEQGIKIKKKLPNFTKYDAVILATNHEEYKKINFCNRLPAKNNLLLVDTVNLIKKKDSTEFGGNIKLLSIGK